VRGFARAHLDTERKHLLAINALLPVLRRSKFLIAWRIAGFLTGLIPAMFGRKSVFATIAAVETFVEHHYQLQIDQIAHRGGHAELRRLLIEFQKDEQSHRLEAIENLSALNPDGLLDRQYDHMSPPVQVPLLIRRWCELVSVGSELAVKIARVI